MNTQNSTSSQVPVRGTRLEQFLQSIKPQDRKDKKPWEGPYNCPRSLLCVVSRTHLKIENHRRVWRAPEFTGQRTGQGEVLQQGTHRPADREPWSCRWVMISAYRWKKLRPGNKNHLRELVVTVTRVFTRMREDLFPPGRWGHSTFFVDYSDGPASLRRNHFGQKTALIIHNKSL